MKNATTLKQKNSKQLWAFFALNIILFLIVCFAFSFENNKDTLKSFFYGKGYWLIIAPLLLFIVNGLVSSDQKAALIFWKIENSLPGCRAFSVYAQKDVRVNINQLKKFHGDLPELPKEQNILWYKIFKSYKNDTIINKSHQDFLLARDMCSMAFLFAVILPLPVAFLSNHPLRFAYILALVFQYLIMVIVGRNYGVRFVTNVLASESLRKR